MIECASDVNLSLQNWISPDVVVVLFFEDVLQTSHRNDAHKTNQNEETYDTVISMISLLPAFLHFY